MTENKEREYTYKVSIGPKTSNGNGEQAHGNKNIGNFGSSPHGHMSWVFEGWWHRCLNDNRRWFSFNQLKKANLKYKSKIIAIVQQKKPDALFACWSTVIVIETCFPGIFWLRLCLLGDINKKLLNLQTISTRKWILERKTTECSYFQDYYVEKFRQN